VVVESEISIQPEKIEDRLHPIADHRPVASKPKRDETLDVLCQMGGQGDTDRVSGNLFVPEAMPGRKAQFAPGKLAQAIKGVSKGRLLPLLARGKAIPPTVEIAEGKQRRLLIQGGISCVKHTDAWPLRGRRASEALTRAHTSTWVLK
jgi:hypothetical protein